MSEIKKVTDPREYLSTRQSAKYLQVSLGTVQKMVESGELLAWKTHGGHRRILASSLEQVLVRRRMGIKMMCKQQYVLLAVFKKAERFEPFWKISQCWSSQVDTHMCCDTIDSLMNAVILLPDIIFLDEHLSPYEKMHLLHYLSKNPHTRHTPILIDNDFVKENPHIYRTSYTDTLITNQPKYELNPRRVVGVLVEPYPNEPMYLDNENLNMAFAEKLEKIMCDCVGRRYEEAL